MQGGGWGEPEEAAERAQGAADAGGHLGRGGEEGGDFRAFQEGFELAAIGGGFVAEDAEQPGVSPRKFGRAGAWPGNWGARARRADAMRPGAQWEAGGEAGHQAGDAAADAGHAGPEGDGVIADDTEAGGDEDGEGAENLVEPAGEFGGRVLGCR